MRGSALLFRRRSHFDFPLLHMPNLSLFHVIIRTMRVRQISSSAAPALHSAFGSFLKRSSHVWKVLSPLEGRDIRRGSSCPFGRRWRIFVLSLFAQNKLDGRKGALSTLGLTRVPRCSVLLLIEDCQVHYSATSRITCFLPTLSFVFLGRK